ncbi:MAG: preprotein translocase subunit SecG [Clostridia bacterium]|nr:preprotein translocase subunit SecG [Clostridia bacterium]
MTILEIALSIIYLLGCIALIVVVLMQDSKSEGIGVITGGTDSLFSQKKGKSKEQVLGQLTIVLGVFFGVVALALGVLLTFFS